MNTREPATRPSGIHQEFNAYVTNIIPRPSLKSPRCVSYTKMIYCPSAEGDPCKEWVWVEIQKWADHQPSVKEQLEQSDPSENENTRDRDPKAERVD